MSSTNSTLINFKRSGLALATGLVLSVSCANAALVSDYTIITEMKKQDGHALQMSDSELGAIGSNSSTSEPGSLPNLPGGTVRTVNDGVFLDGNVAILGNGTISLSKSDINSINSGWGNQGIDCDSSYNNCTDQGSQISSDNRFNQSSPNESFSDLSNSNGVQGGADFSDLVEELDSIKDAIDSAFADATINLSSSGGKVDNESNEIWDFTGGSTGLAFIDIATGGNDFSINNSNLTIKGDADDFLIFRIEEDETMKVSNSNLLLDGNIGVNNVLFYVDANAGESSFDFSNAISYGMSLWDLGLDKDNRVSFSNVQFCGQMITDQVDLSNASGSDCAFRGFDTAISAVPLPPAMYLFGTAILGLLGFGRRKLGKGA